MSGNATWQEIDTSDKTFWYLFTFINVNILLYIPHGIYAHIGLLFLFLYQEKNGH